MAVMDFLSAAPAAAAPPAASPFLGRVLGDTKAIQSAAAGSMQPTLDAYDAEVAKTEAAKKEQAKVLQDQLDEQQRIQAMPVAPAPAPPVLEKLDAPAPSMPKVDPLRTMIQMLPILAALGTAKTQDGARMALDAGTAVLNAQQAGDKASFERAHQQWLDGMKQTLENNQIAQDDYKNIMENHTISWNEKIAALTESATLHKDKLALAALSAGNPEAIVKRAELLKSAADPLTRMYEHATSQAIQWAQLSETQRNHMVEEALAQARIDKEPNATTQNVIGEILKKQASGAALSSGEQEVLKTYSDWRKSDNGLAALAQLSAAGGGAAPAAPQPAGRAVAPAPAPAAAASPPVSALKEGVVTQFANGQKWTLKNGKPVKVG